MTMQQDNSLHEAIQRVRDAEFAKARNLPPEVAQFISNSLAKLKGGDFRELLKLAPSATKLESVVEEILHAYVASLESETVERTQRDFKKMVDKLIESASLLHKAFALPLFESADGGFGLMTSHQREQFLARLEQAKIMLAVARGSIEATIAATPKTRKRHGERGARTQFQLLIGAYFEREFGAPHDRLVADIASVFFDLGPNSVADSVNTQSARRRWKKRRPPMPELSVSLDESLKRFEHQFRAALAAKKPNS